MAQETSSATAEAVAWMAGWGRVERVPEASEAGEGERAVLMASYVMKNAPAGMVLVYIRRMNIFPHVGRVLNGWKMI